MKGHCIVTAPAGLADQGANQVCNIWAVNMGGWVANRPVWGDPGGNLRYCAACCEVCAVAKAGCIVGIFGLDDECYGVRVGRAGYKVNSGRGYGGTLRDADILEAQGSCPAYCAG